MSEKFTTYFLTTICILFTVFMSYLMIQDGEDTRKQNKYVRHSSGDLNDLKKPLIRIGKAYEKDNFTSFQYMVTLIDKDGVVVKVYDKTLYEMKSDTIK